MDHVSWSLGLFKKTLLEVGLTQNWETMAIRTLTTIELFYFSMREDPHEEKPIERRIWLTVWSHMTLHHTWRSVTTLHCFFETKGRHANAKAQEAIDHLASFLSSREEISQPWLEPPSSSSLVSSRTKGAPIFDTSMNLHQFSFLIFSL